MFIKDGLNVLIPPKINRNTMYYLISEIVDEKLNVKDDPVNFIFHDLDFIEPVGVTILSNLLEWLKCKDIEFRLSYSSCLNRIGNKDNPIKYLDDSGFFKKYCGSSFDPTSEVRETTIELEHIAFTDVNSWLDDKFIPWLSNAINLEQEYLVDVSECLLEIFNNIKEHAKAQIGCVFAQHFPKNNEVIISVSDFGVGIPNTVRTVCPGIDDDEALLKSVQKGFTSKKDKSGGAGLDILLQNVLENNQGEVYIHLNCGILSCSSNKSNVAFIAKGFYPGTLFEIVFKTNLFSNSKGEEEEFVW
ncbi:hypothetical protein AJ85_04730 [Alkalihalobacillus alcalophilus ATCC 27647 = CGMCC 1.3604]|uniref:Histidine kinase/HSP90-like ATPase domain-containing protein n=1 Tax=Alkalihalobacillus alcalophilus ATCC 27647 = CGMCC 1.3604 TaxID=1218173 RepID=A0A094WIE7_ALKAL|nr:ATP-binding protein [Alkalihalobacillus alcalophilus]KGA95678.1 hypothetical protein BALCAV_0220960 [Alkalihalobacillus alcalophilus ATCC 27647 = CGMCC 1.3604]MED1563232.1 ATP-binding protein [Alkalihalobacillus alcalophilus]THG91460.1 hypothetical protein AJ85_04730 [Alkalihalobacillus alcalophilus ATCC 27647 = CGMCC 1.3604]